jgi:hypothetical protein
VLSVAGAPVEHVAAQLLLAPPEMVQEAVPPLREAARRAASEGAHENAAAYLRRALEAGEVVGREAPLRLRGAARGRQVGHQASSSAASRRPRAARRTSST